MTKHSDLCLHAQLQYAEAVKKFEVEHPNYCRHCGGWGYHSYPYDPSPAGVSLAPGVMYDADPCSYCVEKGICPQCGDTTNEDGDKCEHCGWTYDNSQGLPEEPDCGCWEEELDELSDKIQEEKDRIFREGPFDPRDYYLD